MFKNRRTSLIAFFVACAAFVTLVVLPATAAAQDPLRLSFVNASKSGGDSAHETISEFLQASEDIETTPQGKVWDEAAELDMGQVDFRSSKKRDDSAKEFRQIMKALDIEALMILDVYSKGRKLQVVVIGPKGTEVADIRQDIKRGRVSKSKARDVLKDAFGALVPEVKEFRDAGGWDAVEEEPEEKVADADLLPDDEEEEGEEEEEGDLKEKAVNKKRAEYGSLREGYRLNLGALVGQRGLLVEGANDVNIEHQSPFVGFGGEITGILSTFGAGDSAVGFSVFGGYAPFTTVFDGSTEIASEYARLGAQLEYHNMLAPTYGIELFGGAEATSVTLEKNPNYTGNRYISGRAGLNGIYIFSPVRLYAGGAVLPVFNTNNSDGAYGEAAFHLAFELNAGLGFGITDDISATLGYTLQSYGPDYTEPQVRLTGPAASSDVMHTGLISIGYAL